MLSIFLATAVAPLAPLTPGPILHARTPARTNSVSQEGERESLEQMLERLRKRRAQLLADLDRRVKPLLDQLRVEVENKSGKKMAELRERLAALGPAIAPLLVDSLDPGASPDRVASEFSRQIARTLLLLPTTSITEKLLWLAENSTPLAKRNALRVLAVNPEPHRVSPRLLELYQKSEGEDRGAVLVTLAELGGEHNDKLLRDVLHGKDELLREVALDAIVSAGAEQFANEFLTLLRDLDRSANYAFKISTYYATCPDVVEKDHVSALVDAAIDSRVTSAQRIGILQQLRQWERLIDSRMKRTLKGVDPAADRNVERQSQILLALLGDSGARRDLLKPYDEEVDKAGLWSGPYVSRGTVLYEIAEYKQALRDFKQAIKLSRDEPKSVPAAFEYAARCCAKQDNLKQAAEYLEKAPIDTKTLQALGHEPVFQELRESRYGKVFRLED